MPAADSTHHHHPRPQPAHTTHNPRSAHVHPYTGTSAGKGGASAERKQAGIISLLTALNLYFNSYNTPLPFNA